MQCLLTSGGFCLQMAAVPPVPPVAPAPPAPVPDLQAVFAICGITAEVTCTRVIMNEGFASLEDLSVLESNTDVTEMVKYLASCTAADGHVDLRTVQIKKIQALVWWVCDEIKHGQALTAADWDAPAVNMVMECKCIDKECESADVGVKDLVKFDPDDFDIHEDAFLDMLAQTCGIQGEPVHCVVCNPHIPAAFADDAEECMCQLLLTGPSFDEDNCTVFCRLKAFLVNTPGWAWIEPCNSMENGCQAFMAWVNHCNGEGKLSKCTQLAKAWSQLARINVSMSFEWHTELLTKSFATLDEDVDEHLSDHQKVEKSLKGIRAQMWNLWQAKQSSCRIICVTSLVLAHVFPNRLPICMVEHNWKLNIVTSKTFLKWTLDLMEEDVAEDVLRVDVAIEMDVADGMTEQLWSMELMFQIPQGTLQVPSGKPCSTMVDGLMSCKLENGWIRAVDEVDEEEMAVDVDEDETFNSVMLQQWMWCNRKSIKLMRWMHVLIRVLKPDVENEEVAMAADLVGMLTELDCSGCWQWCHTLDLDFGMCHFCLLCCQWCPTFVIKQKQHRLSSPSAFQWFRNGASRQWNGSHKAS